jgi:uncharacterized protein YbjT (DUF2867 family)
MSIAIVIGATGLVGSNLLRLLLTDSRYTRVVALVRRATQVRHSKFEEHVVDFGAPASFADLVKGDVLFSAMGTTRSQAGSVEAQRTVDYTYQLEVAKLAARSGVPTYVLVSSGGANATSPFAYMKMKGELERDVKSLGFSALHILQPGPLAGTREKPRLGEAIGVAMLGALTSVGLFRQMRPIDAELVARAMLRVASMPGSKTHGPEELFTLAASIA